MASNARVGGVAAVTDAGREPAAAARIEWIDNARGLAILLVVFGHAAGGLIDAAGPSSMPALRTLFLAIYTFHMPIFFFLSGMFVERRIEQGFRDFSGKLLVLVVFPYFLWSIVQFTAIFALGSLVNHPAGNYWSTIVVLPFRALSPFWFLQTLFLINIVAFAAWRFGGRRAVFGIALLAKLVAMFVPTTPAINLAASNAPYVALGLLLGWPQVSRMLTRAMLEARVLIVIGAVVVIALLTFNADSLQPYTSVATASSGQLSRVAWIPAMLPGTLLGGAALLILADGLSRRDTLFTPVIRYLGTMSMPIFLLHVMFIAGTRILLARLFGVGGIAALPILVIAGIAGPLLVRWATDQLGLTRKLALG